MFDPLTAAARAVKLARAGTSLYFEDGPVGDLERDTLAEGLPLWLKAKAGHLYIAVNASWPGLFKIGCTRKSIESRMKGLSGAGLPTAWVEAKVWDVYDAYGLEALVHRACAEWRSLEDKELFHAPFDVLVCAVDKIVQGDRTRLSKALGWFLPSEFCEGATLH
jgi:hypothetical protein